MVFKNASELIKKAMAKVVQLKPEQIDEALIKKAVEGMKSEM